MWRRRTGVYRRRRTCPSQWVRHLLWSWLEEFWPEKSDGILSQFLSKSEKYHQLLGCTFLKLLWNVDNRSPLSSEFLMNSHLNDTDQKNQMALQFFQNSSGFLTKQVQKETCILYFKFSIGYFPERSSDNGILEEFLKNFDWAMV